MEKNELLDVVHNKRVEGITDLIKTIDRLSDRLEDSKSLIATSRSNDGHVIIDVNVNLNSMRDIINEKMDTVISCEQDSITIANSKDPGTFSMLEQKYKTNTEDTIENNS